MRAYIPSEKVQVRLHGLISQARSAGFLGQSQCANLRRMRLSMGLFSLLFQCFRQCFRKVQERFG